MGTSELGDSLGNETVSTVVPQAVFTMVFAPMVHALHYPNTA